jgi:hypothetical protein
MFKPIKTFADVVNQLVHGLEDGTVSIPRKHNQALEDDNVTLRLVYEQFVSTTEQLKSERVLPWIERLSLLRQASAQLSQLIEMLNRKAGMLNSDMLKGHAEMLLESASKIQRAMFELQEVAQSDLRDLLTNFLKDVRGQMENTVFNLLLGLLTTEKAHEVAQSIISSANIKTINNLASIVNLNHDEVTLVYDKVKAELEKLWPRYREILSRFFHV